MMRDDAFDMNKWVLSGKDKEVILMKGLKRPIITRNKKCGCNADITLLLFRVGIDRLSIGHKTERTKNKIRSTQTRPTLASALPKRQT
jgi:hypothetical protein